MPRRLLQAPLTYLLLAVLAAGASFGLYWFQPWTLFTNTTVDDALSSPSTSASRSGDGSGAESAQNTVSGPVVVRQGEFVTHEHRTVGAARIVRTAAGDHQLELIGLSTSDGPDLRVWLTDQEVRTGAAGWRLFDDGRYVELGRLKGNRGDQVYPIAADVDVSVYRSVTVWCRRFSVSFGAAELR